jgi:pimeloyl-ACP methyl ester carboxylesterase
MTATHDVGHAAGRIHTVAGGAGLALHVREWGPEDAPPVLLIHGWSGNHLCWNHQVSSDLAGEFRLVALDLRGHGMSDHPLEIEQYRNAQGWADDIAAVLEQCHLERAVLVGWSYGGFVICDYLRAYGQDAVSAINLVGAAVTLNERFDDIGPEFLANAPGGADPDLPTRIAALRRFWHHMTAQPLDRADFETGLSGSVAVRPEVLGGLISRQIKSDDVLSRLRMPVLVTHGRRDQIVSPSMADHVLRTCPTATASWYDTVGHAPFIEDAERFNRELSHLVRSVAA